MKVSKLEIDVGPKHCKLVVTGMIDKTRFERQFDVSLPNDDLRDDNPDMSEPLAKLIELVHKRIRDRFLDSLQEEGIR